MKYIAKIYNNIIYSICMFSDDYKIGKNEAEISYEEFVNAKVPCVFGDNGRLVKTDIYPDFPSKLPDSLTAEELEKLKEQKQVKNKEELATCLRNNPITWTNGKKYGITEEDQQELSLNLMQYQLAVGAGASTTLEWHAIHEACTEWTFEELTALSLFISATVYPYLRKMQSFKEKIYGSETKEEIDRVEFDYSIEEA